MFQTFLRLSKKRSEIYPLLGAVSVALGAGVFFSSKHLIGDPSLRFNPRTRSNQPSLRQPEDLQE